MSNKSAPKLVFINEIKWERFGCFLNKKIDMKVKFGHYLTPFDFFQLHQFSKF